MNMLKTIAILMLLGGLALTGCKEKTPSEKAADAMKEGAEAVKEGAKDVGEKVGDAAEKAGDKAKEITK